MNNARDLAKELAFRAITWLIWSVVLFDSAAASVERSLASSSAFARIRNAFSSETSSSS